MIEDVADEIDRAAEHGLCAIAAVGGIDAAVVEDADVVDAAIGFDVVVAQHVEVVVVDVDRRSATFGVLFGRAVSGDTDRVVEISNGVVRDDVAGAVDLDGVVTLE